METIINTAYTTSTAAVQGFITSTVIPLWIWLLGIAVLMFVVGRVFGVFRKRRAVR